jgi:hypothetical protein
MQPGPRATAYGLLDSACPAFALMAGDLNPVSDMPHIDN